MKTVTVGINQNLVDIALQEYGNPSAIGYLLEDNPDKVNFGDPIVVPGDQLQIREGIYELAGTIPEVVANYLRTDKKPAILDPNGDAGGMQTRRTGIGFMEIGNDFVVS